MSLASATQESGTSTAMKQKVFVPLENNPDVMTKLAHTLGLSSNYVFHDVLSLDEPSLLSMIPRPCYAILFTYPNNDLGQQFYAKDEASRPPYNGSGADEPVLFFHQTIRHACGLIGLLHCLANTQCPGAIEKESRLEILLKAATSLKQEQRSQLLYDSDMLEAAHAEAAQQGDSIAPLAEEYDDNHAFITWVKGTDGRLWELEGRRKGPVDRGLLEEDEDLLSQNALDLGPRSYIKREIEDGRFSLIALSNAA